jgi:hypothetical protein
LRHLTAAKPARGQIGRSISLLTHIDSIKRSEEKFRSLILQSVVESAAIDLKSKGKLKELKKARLDEARKAKTSRDLPHFRTFTAIQTNPGDNF